MTTERSKPLPDKAHLGRVLIVDDEPDIAMVVERRLRSSGYDVIVARDGFEALSMTRLENPDIIVLDLMLPGIDGHQVCSLLKTDRRFRSVPIIILSARIELDAINASVESGADAYICKPFDHQVLVAQIELLLRARRAQSEESSETEPPTRLPSDK